MSQVAFTYPFAPGIVSGSGASAIQPIVELASRTSDMMFQDYLFGVSATGFSGAWGVRLLAKVGGSAQATFAPVGITAFSTTGFTPLAALFGATVMQGIPRPFAVEWCSANAGVSQGITAAFIGVLHNPG